MIVKQCYASNVDVPVFKCLDLRYHVIRVHLRWASHGTKAFVFHHQFSVQPKPKCENSLIARGYPQRPPEQAVRSQQPFTVSPPVTCVHFYRAEGSAFPLFIIFFTRTYERTIGVFAFQCFAALRSNLVLRIYMFIMLTWTVRLFRRRQPMPIPVRTLSSTWAHLYEQNKCRVCVGQLQKKRQCRKSFVILDFLSEQSTQRTIKKNNHESEITSRFVTKKILIYYWFQARGTWKWNSLVKKSTNKCRHEYIIVFFHDQYLGIITNNLNEKVSTDYLKG